MSKLQKQKARVKSIPKVKKLKEIQDVKEAVKEVEMIPVTKLELRIASDDLVAMLKVMKNLQGKINQQGAADGILSDGEELRYKKGIDAFKAIEQMLTEQKIEHETIDW